MAATVAGQQLTERHRRRQLAVRAAAVAQVVALWRMFDPRAIDESWTALRPALMTVVDLGRRGSSEAAADYYSAFRTAEGVPGRYAPPLVFDDGWRLSAEASLHITGPAAAKRAVALNRPDVARLALASVAGSVTRHVLNAGRETVLRGVREDPRAVGWARTTSGDPCAFCAMLAGRGGVYSKRSVDFRAHDNCACGSEPVYDRSAPLPGRAEEFRRLYQESTAGAESGQLLNAFRRAYEGRE